MLGHKRVPSREGGIEIVVEELASRMVAEGHSVTCYNRRGHHVSGAEFDGKQLSEYKGIKIKTVPTINRKGLAAMTSSFFAAVKAAFGHYDIIHIHAEGPAAMLLDSEAVWEDGCSYNTWIRLEKRKWKGGFGSKYIKFGEKCTVKFADQIIVLSEGVRNYFMDTYGRKTVFIPNGVNRPVKREPDEIRKRWGLEKDSYILFLGRLVLEKGLRYLVEAYKGLKTYKKLVIAGGARTRTLLQRS
ncbi:MAG: glycosyltransferase family 4 protein [Enterocloster clostridioformis]